MAAFDKAASESLAARCAADGEFRLAARFWTGGMRLEAPSGATGVTVTDGVAGPGVPARGAPGVITLAAAEDAWSDLLRAVPPRLANDAANLIGAGRMSLKADPVLYAQYYPALARAIELLRPAAPAAAPVAPARRPGAFDSPVGRYVHLELDGRDHRVYFEEAGSGIPLLLQHTAGCHGAQWRHLFECEAITRRFRLIAYDLPFHGKSLPPAGVDWWAQDYRLTAPFLRSVPVALARALELDRPAFMGCSVGGLLALDLALHHADLFRAVISVEGALKIDQEIERLAALWHPQVSNEYKARLMDALMSPTSPAACRKETSFVYAAGWPPAFLGDLYYYLVDYDLTARAREIDTAKVAVHILNGEYDSSGAAELGRAAHEAIPGSTWSMMEGLGHFPMSENPDAFLRCLLPILDQIAARAQANEMA